MGKGSLKVFKDTCSSKDELNARVLQTPPAALHKTCLVDYGKIKHSSGHLVRMVSVESGWKLFSIEFSSVDNENHSS